jgi:ABC-2 type transport system permease protein
MVRVLVAMRGFALANARQSKFGILSLVGAGLLGLFASAVTLLMGFTAPLAGGDAQIALVLLAWVAGRIGFAGFSGADPAMPLDFFRMLPLHRAALSRALLVLGLADPAMYFLALAYGSLVVFGFRHSLIGGVLGIVGMLLLTALTSILSTIVSALVPVGSRRRQDAGTLLAAVLISAVLVTSTLAPAILAALAQGRDTALALVLQILPTGWAGDSVALGSAGHPWEAVGLLVALVVACVGLAAWWPRVLTNRLESVGGSGRRHRAHAGRRILPETPTGTIASRELRLWVRDPTRAGFLLIAMVVGLGVCVVPLVSKGADFLLPFAGLGTIVIAAAVAGNSYGFDGPAFGLTLTTPGAERADVRGRQLAWLLIVGPYAALLSIGGVLIAGRPDYWVWVLGLLPAVLGAAAGISLLVSAIAPQPLDDGGGPTPAWVVKAYATMILTVVAITPVLALLIIGGVVHAAWVGWVGVPVGIAIGVVAAVRLGASAIGRLERHGPEMLEALASSPAGRK